MQVKGIGIGGNELRFRDVKRNYSVSSKVYEGQHEDFEKTLLLRDLFRDKPKRCRLNITDFN